MKVLGIFRELGRRISQSAPSIHAAAGALSSSEAAVVGDYLRAGVPIFDVMESTVDPFDKAVRIDGGPSLVSDGTWVWRMDLAYFVEKYRVGLPREFLDRAMTMTRARDDESSIVARWEEALAAYDLAEKSPPAQK